jgi:hypothetical protein
MGCEMKQGLIVLFLCFGMNAVAQDKGAQSFVLDQTKPYVYLRFDHIGPRKPLRTGEDGTGIWLRVVNNCRLPIAFASFSVPAGGAGVGLMDEVVEAEPMMQIYSTPEEGREIQKREKIQKLKHKPEGYWSETAGVVRVQPGEDILFSVPRNHVDDDWYMRVKFALDLDKSSVAVGPFTYLPFYEWDIPKESRSSATPAHEADHLNGDGDAARNRIESMMQAVYNYDDARQQARLCDFTWARTL